jgi:4-hydroxybenzoate polyprenyltransferase
VTRVPDAPTIAELVRLPSVLTVPGDVLLGTSASRGAIDVARTAGLAVSSCCLYLAGMALNDYADRAVDAEERPHRPIPSGRVDPVFALRLAQGLTAASVVAAMATGGRRALAVTLPLATTVWAYDLKFKSTRAGPATMALARGLDVMHGALSGSRRAALAPATVVAGHTLTVTLVSRHEARGGTSLVGRAALAGTAAVTAGAAAVVAGLQWRGSGRRALARPVSRPVAAASVGLLGAYAATVGRAELAAARDPSPQRLQRAVGTGVLGLMPLEAAMLAGTGQAAAAGAVAAAWPLARRLARRRSVT